MPSRSPRRSGRGSRAEREGENIILAGNFNLRRADSKELEALTASGLTIDPQTLHPSTFTQKHYYDVIGLLMQGAEEATVGGSGAFNPFDHVYRVDEEHRYTPDVKAGGYRMWRTKQLSDHLPVWLELRLSGRVQTRETETKS